MNIKSIGFCNISKTNLNKIQNNMSNINKNISFKGGSESQELPSSYIIDMYSVIQNPQLLLMEQLIKDGFSMKDIKEGEIFKDIDLKKGIDIEYLVEHCQELRGKVTGNDLFDRMPKGEKDIKAMCRVYQSLKSKFITDDVREYNDEMLEIQREVDKFLGCKTPEDKNIKSLIMQVLHYTNQYNEPIVETLLNDENFNNVSIKSALMGIKTQEDADSAMKVINSARKIGYDKEFTFPLAIMISESNANNMPIIEKALTEQDFFTADEYDDFASTKLMTFLRNFDELTLLYLTDDTVGLKEINELMDCN